MEGKVQVLTLGGVPIYVHASWLLVYALITWSLAVGYFPQALPDLPPLAYWANGLLAALLLFVSVLLHELSHALVARAHGLRVNGITLHVFGGVSQLEDEPPTPRAEFLIAIVGPLTSFAIATLLWGTTAAGLVPVGWPRATVGYLTLVNVSVGVFNLIPGFPLDGGRLLRAALWKWQGALGRATRIASRVGVGFAVALMAFGVVQILTGAVVSGFWMILLGLFLRSAADTSAAQTTLHEALDALPVRDVMTRDVISIGPDATVAQLVDRFWAHHVTSFPVVDNGTVHGIASLHQLRQVPRERWPDMRVRELMRPLDAELVIRSGDSVFEALDKASRNSLGRLAVLDGSRLVGYVSLKDITHVLALRGGPVERAA
ncbi:MAG: site-2 protease family protein [Candidatus Rokuibacteriota bacterium]